MIKTFRARRQGKQHRAGLISRATDMLLSTVCPESLRAGSISHTRIKEGASHKLNPVSHCRVEGVLGPEALGLVDDLWLVKEDPHQLGVVF